MAIEFRKTSSPDPVVAYLAIEITKNLSDGKKVLWLVSGGSSMAIAADVADKIKAIDLRNLTVSLVDERYGPVGHSDSNWLQLTLKGFHLPSAKLIPLLDGSSIEATVRRFDKTLAREIKNADFKIALIGIGADSHVAGIKPRSPATTAGTMAVGYEWDDYWRITMTFASIELMDTAVAYLAGEAKQSAIKDLEADAPMRRVPSQILKRVKKAIVFNDQIGEAIS